MTWRSRPLLFLPIAFLLLLPPDGTWARGSGHEYGHHHDHHHPAKEAPAHGPPGEMPLEGGGLVRGEIDAPVH